MDAGLEAVHRPVAVGRRVRRPGLGWREAVAVGRLLFLRWVSVPRLGESGCPSRLGWVPLETERWGPGSTEAPVCRFEWELRTALVLGCWFLPSGR